MQLSTQGLGDEFRSEEKALWEQLLLALLLRVADIMPDRTIMILLVNYAGLLIMDPTQMAQGNCTTLCVVTRNLVTALQGFFEFRSGECTQLLTKRMV